MQHKRARKPKPAVVPPRLQQPVACSAPVAADYEAIAPYLNQGTCRYFVLKTFSEADVHKSIKYGIWTSTYISNHFLDAAFGRDLSCMRPILFFFSVCGSKHFCGIARMTSGLHSDRNFLLWEKTKYEGYFNVEWLVVKDVPNHALKTIVLPNDGKNITSVRDCDEIPFNEASEFMQRFVAYEGATSLLEDMEHYDTLQRALETKRGLINVPPTADVDDFLAPATTTEVRRRRTSSC
ncbi:hypothetical protein SPRG_12063 [Saprolegnia parasitica CBS 223.65]|uniref:YTH domain-containing protein n=1 Tax=Saprolegnia parasitica (strain CBS 223.65) TaxID=695850 RepID=A0A067C5J8_SAPPC|nr:hypothetical protein SPRG_12063 [Saprolegnia parasitica CBS 223.65]KDO22077.1 hypothetical protein SPRG_12063 [Saprolegnia parasitica CBS 223.65]|eukprot:XP_012207219.1 hypothetical protein SPRG_12063 [Saprolegnia parasitica CBS 223.65]